MTRNLMKAPKYPESFFVASPSFSRLSSEMHPVSNEAFNHKWFVVPINVLRRSHEREGTRIRRTPLEEVSAGPWMMQLRQQQNQHQNQQPNENIVRGSNQANHQSQEARQIRKGSHNGFAFSQQGKSAEELPQNDEPYFPLQPDLEQAHQQQQFQRPINYQSGHKQQQQNDGRFLDDVNDYEYRKLEQLYPTQFLFDLQGMSDDQLKDLKYQVDNDPQSVQDSLLEAFSSPGGTAMSSGERKGGPNANGNLSNPRNHQLGIFQKMLQEHKSDNNKADSGLKLSEKIKRGEGPQLSVVSPLDVLRQQLIYELARRRIKENREKIQVNDQLLKTIGKRSVDPNFDPRSLETSFMEASSVHQREESLNLSLDRLNRRR